MRVFKSLRRILKVRWKGGCFVSDFGSVQNLIDYLWLKKSRSERSILAYLLVLSRFCVWAKSDPEEILQKSREELEVLVQKYLDEIQGRSRQHGLSSRYVNSSGACLKTFFRKNGFNGENNQELRLEGYHQPPRTRNRDQYVPTLGEACRMAERGGNRRNCAIILTLFSTGLRNAALRAVLIRDVINEIEAGHENLLIKIEPAWNKRILGSCKGGIPYYSFTSAQATQAIKEMLKRRKEIFGFVGEDEPLFISGGSQLSNRKPLSERELQEIVKNSAREAGIEKWIYVSPHALRKVFEGVLRSPLNEGDRMDPKDQEFLMGHILSGTQEAYYNSSEINKLRGQFAKLVFEDKGSPQLESLGMRKQIAHLLGIDTDQVKAKKEMELGRAIRASEEAEALEAAIKTRLDHRQDARDQEIIHKDKLQAYLDDGWRFLSKIDETTVVVEREKSVANSIGNNPALLSSLAKK